MKMQCDLLDVLFRMCDAVARLASPAKKYASASASLAQYFLVRPLITVSRAPVPAANVSGKRGSSILSTICRLSACVTSSARRSYMTSL